MRLKRKEMEVWKTHPEYKFYQLSNLGRIRHTNNENIGSKICKGYIVIYIRKHGQRKLHQLILETFIGPKPIGKVTRHFDGNKLNNRLDNLSWGTEIENAQDRVRHGRQYIGTFSEKCRQRAVEANKGHKRWLGKKHKPETIEKMRNKVFSQETRRKMSESRKRLFAERRKAV